MPVEPQQAMSEGNGHRPDRDVARNGELPADAPDRERRNRAAMVFMRYHYEGKPLAKAWAEVHPGTAATDKSKAEMASTELRWLRRTYPLDISNRLDAHGLDEDDMLERMKALSGATRPLKVGSKKTFEYDDEGRVVRQREEILYKQVPDWWTRVAMVKLQAALHGHGAGASRRPLSDEGKSLEDVKRLMDPPEEIPKTVEEALNKGQPITLIEHPEAISPEQWDREWAAYQKERDRKRREDPDPQRFVVFQEATTPRAFCTLATALSTQHPKTRPPSSQTG